MLGGSCGRGQTGPDLVRRTAWCSMGFAVFRFSSQAPPPHVGPWGTIVEVWWVLSRRCLQACAYTVD
eukprot:12992891-Alexandrium_andersonii.AAC.1